MSWPQTTVRLYKTNQTFPSNPTLRDELGGYSFGRKGNGKIKGTALQVDGVVSAIRIIYRGRSGPVGILRKVGSESRDNFTQHSEIHIVTRIYIPAG